MCGLGAPTLCFGDEHRSTTREKSNRNTTRAFFFL